jgi:hypothetical protein
MYHPIWHLPQMWCLHCLLLHREGFLSRGVCKAKTPLTGCVAQMCSLRGWGRGRRRPELCLPRDLSPAWPWQVSTILGVNRLRQRREQATGTWTSRGLAAAPAPRPHRLGFCAVGEPAPAPRVRSSSGTLAPPRCCAPRGRGQAPHCGGGGGCCDAYLPHPRPRMPDSRRPPRDAIAPVSRGRRLLRAPTGC